eukprot:5600547-Prorocentrum_lima.AAC.1
MHLKQSRKHPGKWLMMKGPRPKDQHTLADPVPPGKFADTHTCVKGTVKGDIAMFMDDLCKLGIRQAT